MPASVCVGSGGEIVFEAISQPQATRREDSPRDERPIKQSTKTFEQLLEENLTGAPKPAAVGETSNAMEKPVKKKQFLKRRSKAVVAKPKPVYSGAKIAKDVDEAARKPSKSAVVAPKPQPPGEPSEPERKSPQERKPKENVYKNHVETEKNRRKPKVRESVDEFEKLEKACGKGKAAAAAMPKARSEELAHEMTAEEKLKVLLACLNLWHRK